MIFAKLVPINNGSSYTISALRGNFRKFDRDKSKDKGNQVVMDEKTRQHLCEKYAKELEIYDVLNNPISTNSHGMRQKLALKSKEFSTFGDISQAPQNEIINQTFRELDRVNKNTEANQAETLENQSRNGQKYELGTIETERPKKSLFRRIFGLRRRAVAQLEEERLQEDLRNELRADLGENRALSNRELINRKMREIYERESNRELGE